MYYYDYDINMGSIENTDIEINYIRIEKINGGMWLIVYELCPLSTVVCVV